MYEAVKLLVCEALSCHPPYNALCMCPHTSICAIYVSSYYCMSVLIPLYMCPQTTTCVLILRIWLRSVSEGVQCGSPRCCMFVLTLLHMRPHTTIYPSSSYRDAKLLQALYMSHTNILHMCPHTTVANTGPLSRYICVLILILLHMRPLLQRCDSSARGVPLRLHTLTYADVC